MIVYYTGLIEKIREEERKEELKLVRQMLERPKKEN
jgi:hypothetical protein